jgi:hypothetical protein
VADQSQAKVVKKKIRPYPIEANLEMNALKKPVEVILINPKGCIVRLKSQMVTVGEYYQLIFELPVLKEFINTQVRVLKTYDKSIDPKEKKVERLSELHFQALSSEHKARIVAFMSAIGQEK